MSYGYLNSNELKHKYFFMYTHCRLRNCLDSFIYFHLKGEVKTIRTSLYKYQHIL